MRYELGEIATDSPTSLWPTGPRFRFHFHVECGQTHFFLPSKAMHHPSNFIMKASLSFLHPNRVLWAARANDICLEMRFKPTQYVGNSGSPVHEKEGPGTKKMTAFILKWEQEFACASF